MWDIKLIRKEPQILDNSMKKRGLEACSEHILKLDMQIRQLQQLGDKLRAELKANSKTAPSQEQIETNKKLGKEIKENETQYNTLSVELESIMSGLPNLVSDETPSGLTEEDNQIIRIHENDHKINNPKTHEEVAQHFLSKASGAKIAGARFAVMHAELAKLARCLSYWLLEENTKAGYQETNVPYIMNEDVAYGMGVLPKFSEDLFQLTNGQYLIPTAEACLVGMFNKQEVETPLRLTSLTPCFRAEAGSAGKDTAGLIRMHQFHKVEIVCFVESEEAEAEHQKLVTHVENLLQKLGLGYQVLAMCAGDLGFHAHKKYDIEVWMPGMNKYVEISSCSQCHDFQSRRLKIKNKTLPHTINGSSLPLDRTIAAILENYQTEEGIKIPEVLQKYMGADIIKY